MKKNKKILFVLFTIVLITITLFSLSACNQSNQSTTENNENIEQSISKTILIYMCGSDLESRYSCASDNISELMNSEITENDNVIIQTGGAKTWRNEYVDISSKNISRYQIEHDKIYQLDELLPQASMGSDETLYDFISYGLEKFPSDNVSLIFWDHGSAGVGGVCYDENYGYDYLSLREIDNALNKVTEEYDMKFEMIGFDACLMSTIETANIISNYANNMVASAETEPLGGWNYDNLVKNIGSKEGYKNILLDYEKKCLYENENLYTLSHIDFSNYIEFKQSFNEFTNKLNSTDNLSKAVHSVVQSMSYGVNDNETGSCSIDLADYAQGLNCLDLCNKINDMITCVNSDSREGSCGLSIFFPYFYNERMIKKYVELPIDSNYKTFIEKNFVGCDINNLIEFTDKGSDNNGEIHIGITEESKNYVRNVYYKSYMFLPTDETNPFLGKVRLLGFDSTLNKDENGLGYTTVFGGRWVSWNNEYILCKIVDVVDDVTLFSTPIKLNGVKGNVLFTYYKNTKEIEIAGFVENTDIGHASRIKKLEKGDIVTLLVDERVMGNEYSEHMQDSKSFVYDESINIVVKSFEPGYFQSYVIIEDIYGLKHRSNTFVLYYDGKKITIVNNSSDIGKD